jgi:outer membrane protein assembly complex protein YaeT
MRGWLVCAALLVAAPVLGQQADPLAPPASLGRPVEAIEVSLENAPVTDPALLDLVEVRRGEPLDMAAVRESILHLYSMGRFQDVRVTSEPAPSGGVAVRFDLVPIRSVTALEFRGELGLPAGLLRSTLSDRFGTRPSLAQAAEAASVLESLYRDRGYLTATVRPVAEEGPEPHRTTLVFEVTSGPRARIGRVTIDGDPKTNPEAFQRDVQAVEGAPYQATVIQQKLEAFVSRLRRRGFYEATASVVPTVSEDRRTVALRFDVTTGPAVTIKYEGDQLPAERLRELVPVEREHSVAEDLLEDSVEAIRRSLQQDGYWKADVSVRREEAGGVLTVTFTIHRGQRYYLADPVAFAGNDAISTDALRALVALKAGDVFVESHLSRIASAVTELYRQRGYVDVKVSYTVNDVTPAGATQGRVQPVIHIAEGVQSLVGTITIQGNAALSAAELRPLVRVAPGQPFYAPQLAADRDALTTEYLNNGFQAVTVEATPVFSEDRRGVNVVYRINEGPQTTVDHILIVGNTHTDPAVILGEMRLKPGAPLGREDLIESQRALSALGLFRRVRITELSHGAGTAHDLLVTVDEAPMTTIGYGGGLEASQRLRATGPNGEAEEHLEFAPRGFFNIGRRNVGGRNRTVDFYARVSLPPRDNPSDPELDGTGRGFSEYRVVTTVRQPRAFWDTDFIVTAAAEQGVRSSFNFARRGVNADFLRRITQSVRASARYSLSSTRTYDERLDPEEQAQIDRLFPRVRLSAVSAAVSRDTRDDVLEPRRGTFTSVEYTLAARSLGGEVGFVKTYIQGSWYRQLTRQRPIVFATRAIVGLADGFPRQVPLLDESGAAIPDEYLTIEDLPASERFFAGGDTSIRGYALDTVGAPNTISPDGFPRGGNAVLVMNGELRVPVWRDVGMAAFVDGGNVFERVTQFDAGELLGAAGFGLRYRSPIGPIRLDLGFKMSRREIGGRVEPRAVWHFSIGQAF